MVKIYTDTNVLRYFGEAFATKTLPDEIAVQLLLSPLSLLELLSQLGTAQADEAFAAVQALPRVHNPKGTGILPWEHAFFRMCLFKLPPGEDTMTPALNRAVIRVLNATGAAELRVEGEEMRTLLDQGKAEAATNLASLLDSSRAEGPISEEEHNKIFARSIAQRADVDPDTIDADHIVKSLDAHFRFEKQRIQAGTENSEYAVKRRANDVYDAELLIYLADPSLHLLTCDTGFRRARGSTQADRIHIVPSDSLRDTDRAVAVLLDIANGGKPKP